MLQRDESKSVKQAFKPGGTWHHKDKSLKKNPIAMLVLIMVVFHDRCVYSKIMNVDFTSVKNVTLPEGYV